MSIQYRNNPKDDFFLSESVDQDLIHYCRLHIPTFLSALIFMGERLAVLFNGRTALQQTQAERHKYRKT